MAEPIYEKISVCKQCGCLDEKGKPGGHITFHTLRITSKAFSHYYTCSCCGYSSNGRSTLAEAETDAVVVELK